MHTEHLPTESIEAVLYTSTGQHEVTAHRSYTHRLCLDMLNGVIINHFFSIVIEPKGLDGETFTAVQTSIALYRSEGGGFVLACLSPPAGSSRDEVVLAQAVRAVGGRLF